MITIAIHKHIDSENLTLPEAKQFIGKDVVIIMSEVSKSEPLDPVISDFFKLAGKIILQEDKLFSLKEISCS